MPVQREAMNRALEALGKAIGSGSNFLLIDLNSGLSLVFTDRDYICTSDGKAVRDRAFGTVEDE